MANTFIPRDIDKKERNRRASLKWYHRNNERGRENSRLWRSKNPERMRQLKRDWYLKNRHKDKQYKLNAKLRKSPEELELLRKKYRLYARRHTRLVRETVLSHYGNRCACCGEIEEKFLCIDHINGGGRAHRKAIGLRGGNIYRWLAQHDYPSGFQVLCYNCNSSKGIYGICPHATSEYNTPMELCRI